MTFPGRDSRISEFYHWYTVFYDSLWIYSTQLFMVIALLYSTLARRELGEGKGCMVMESGGGGIFFS